MSTGPLDINEVKRSQRHLLVTIAILKPDSATDSLAKFKIFRNSSSFYILKMLIESVILAQ